MKKLNLIIPLLFIPLYALPDTPIYGCRLGLRIWTTPDFKYHAGAPYFLNDFDHDGNADGYTNNTGRCSAGSYGTCTIINDLDGAVYSTVAAGNIGELSHFSIDNCPLDDNIPLLAIFTLAAVFTAKRKQLHLTT